MPCEASARKHQRRAISPCRRAIPRATAWAMSEPPKPKKDENTRRMERRAAALRENLKRRKAQTRGRMQAENAGPEARIPGKAAQSRKDSDTE